MSSQASVIQTSVNLDKVGQIAVTVSDLARSRDFYQKILGMRFLFDAGNMCFFQCGDIRFMIGASPNPIPRNGTVLYFRVEDIQGTYGALHGQGVVFLEPPHLVARMPDHDLWMAFLSDPDENTLGLMCEVAHIPTQA